MANRVLGTLSSLSDKELVQLLHNGFLALEKGERVVGAALVIDGVHDEWERRSGKFLGASDDDQSADGRPFFPCSIEHLQSIYEVGKEDKVILIALRDELSHRKSRPAIRLREDVDGQIADLEARGLWSRPQPVGISMPGSHQGFLDRGLLNFLDYKVGAARLARSLRHRLLASIALRSLPPFHSAEYMLSWSTPDTEERLLRLANCIAGFTRLAKRRRMANMRDSIADWESDLEYLRREFYQGHWSFIWPET